MDTIIRTHVKNEKRLSDLGRELGSWKDKQLYTLGAPIVIDDGSPMGNSVKLLCKEFGIEYIKAGGTPDTKNGLYQSLACAKAFPVFLCVDDAVFGKGIADRLTTLLEEELNLIPDYGFVGTFACYEGATRNHNKVEGTDLWWYPTDIIYALVGHVFSERLARFVIKEWEEVLSGKLPYPGMCDDIWVKTILNKYNIKAYNTMVDYTQHIGVNNRTFGDNTGSDYVSKMFIGE